MLKSILLFAGLSCWSLTVFSQVSNPDSVRQQQVADSLDMGDLSDMDDLDDLMNDLDAFLDSLLQPRSLFLVNASMSRGYYNYKPTGTTRIQSVSAYTYSPTIAYYHKGGMGITASGFILNDKGSFNLYQYSLSPSYDYLANRSFATGISYTRYFSKDSLAFYVSPLKNELSAYFTYRKSWLRPSVSVNYAWGSREDLKERINFIQSLWLRRRLLNYLQNNYNSRVNDISVTASLLHDFYLLRPFRNNDHFRITPQVIFSSGTQQYGFNQRINTYSQSKITRANLLSTAREFNLDQRKEFRPLSLGFSLRTEYSIGKFYLQPQALADYYFPADTDNLSFIFSINAGVSF